MSAYTVTFRVEWFRSGCSVTGVLSVRVVIDREDEAFAIARACCEIEPLRLTIYGVSAEKVDT